MKIAIHNSNNPAFFSDGWIDYCKQNNIPYKIVNAYDNNIVEQLDGCTFFLWHFSNYDYRDALFAKQLLYSLQKKGIKVFPDFDTAWHFDDKVGQKYLLEAINAPLVPSHVFYSKNEALEWIEKTTFPKVFKLRGGSGSSNVQLVENKIQAKKLVKRAFRKGFSQFNRINHLKFRYHNYRTGKESFIAVIKGVVRLFVGNRYSNMSPQEKGYVYFQDFIPNNNFDTRVVVIGGETAIAEKRFVREGDFRASGSGKYDYENINIETIKVAFDVSRRLNLQSVAFDFVADSQNKPLIVEISYGFGREGISKAPGFWDNNLQWHEGPIKPEKLIIKKVVESFKI